MAGRLIKPVLLCGCCLQLMGMVFESLKQPVINGYLVAGAIVGPGGLQLIKELVQVRLRGFEAIALLSLQYDTRQWPCLCCLATCQVLWCTDCWHMWMLLQLSAGWCGYQLPLLR